jgi:diguanylate cyclase (GGDEF)-like protein
VVIAFESTLQQVLQTQSAASLDYSLPTEHGKVYYEARLLPCPANQVIAIIRNISDLKRAEEHLRHDALHDALTGLPNRSLFMDRVEMAMQRLRRFPQQCFAVFFIDLDSFKQVNDRFGHGVGDQLLMAIADILRSCVRANDTVARLGGDEFTILLDSITHIEEVCQVAERIQDRLKIPLAIADHSILSGASIGIVLGAFRYQQATDLLKDADAALYQAKKAGKGRYSIFEP